MSAESAGGWAPPEEYKGGDGHRTEPEGQTDTKGDSDSPTEPKSMRFFVEDWAYGKGTEKQDADIYTVYNRSLTPPEGYISAKAKKAITGTAEEGFSGLAAGTAHQGPNNAIEDGRNTQERIEELEEQTDQLQADVLRMAQRHNKLVNIMRDDIARPVGLGAAMALGATTILLAASLSWLALPIGGLCLLSLLAAWSVSTDS